MVVGFYKSKTAPSDFTKVELSGTDSQYFINFLSNNDKRIIGLVVRINIVNKLRGFDDTFNLQVITT
jgi:hypothetical protein